jgi:hypothetical protein
VPKLKHHIKNNRKYITPSKLTQVMSSIDNRGENEFADDESNLVGKSESEAVVEDNPESEITKKFKKTKINST